MKLTSHYLQPKSLILIGISGFLVLASAIVTIVPAITVANEKQTSRDKGTVVINTGGGGSAGTHKGSPACPVVSPVLTALVPTYGTKVENNMPQDDTLAERPTFWLYVPYALTEKVPGSLQLLEKDSAGKMEYQSGATVSGTAPGVIGVQLPTGKRLEENQQYKWRFVIICDPNDPTANPSTVAIVSRLPKNPKLEKQLQAIKQPAQRAALYAQNGIWYEALTTLAEQRRANPGDAKISAKWRELLRQGGLSVFDAKSPIQKAP